MEGPSQSYVVQFLHLDIARLISAKWMGLFPNHVHRWTVYVIFSGFLDVFSFSVSRSSWAMVFAVVNSFKTNLPWRGRMTIPQFYKDHGSHTVATRILHCLWCKSPANGVIFSMSTDAGFGSSNLASCAKSSSLGTRLRMWTRHCKGVPEMMASPQRKSIRMIPVLNHSAVFAPLWGSFRAVPLASCESRFWMYK